MTIKDIEKLQKKMEWMASSSYINLEHRSNRLIEAASLPTPGLLEMQRQVSELTKVAVVAFNTFSPTLIEMQQQLNQLFISVKPILDTLSPVLLIMQQQLNMLAKTILPTLIEAEQQVNRLAEVFSPIIKYIRAYQQMDFSSNIYIWAQTFISQPSIKQFGNDDDNFDIITSQEKQEIVDAIIEILDEPINFQQSVTKWFENFKTKNPLVTKLFTGILSAIILIIIATVSNLSAEVIKNAVLREKPTQLSPIINHVYINQSVTIINQMPYYYEIPFTDEVTGETKTGWITKRSVRVFDCEKEISINDNEDNKLEESQDRKKNLMDYIGFLGDIGVPDDVEETFTPEVVKSMLERE